MLGRVSACLPFSLLFSSGRLQRVPGTYRCTDPTRTVLAGISFRDANTIAELDGEEILLVGTARPVSALEPSTLSCPNWRSLDN